MAEVRKGVDRVKELMERHDASPSEAERLNSYDDGVRRSQQFADRRKEIDAGVAAARARATSMRDRYSGGARVVVGGSATLRGSPPRRRTGRREAPEDWHADALPDVAPVPRRRCVSPPPDGETSHRGARRDGQGTKAEDVDAAVGASISDARERERARGAPAAPRRRAREKAKAAGAPVVAAECRGRRVPDADKETRLEELRKRARRRFRPGEPRVGWHPW